MEFAGALNNMLKFQNILALMLLAGSAVLAIFIVIGDRASTSPTATANLTANLNQLPPIEGNFLTEPTQSPIASPEINKLSAKISDEIMRLNPNGPSTADGQQQINAVEPNILAQKVLDSELGNINYPDLSPSIGIAALKIVKTADKTIWGNYLKNFRAILTGNFSNLKINFKTPTAKDFEILVGAYEKTLDQFYSLNAPETLADAHKEEIRLLTIQKISLPVWRTMSKTRSRP